VSTPRDYQIEAVEQIEAAIAAGRSPLYVLPTGAGKTVIAAEIVERAVERGKRVLILTHRREILQQTSRKLNIDHGLLQAGLLLDLEPPALVASVQTIWARCIRTDKVPLPRADILIVDECHHIRAKTWAGIIEAFPGAALVGLTATPCRGDGRGLGNHFDRLILGPQIPDLIAKGRLVPTKYYAPVQPDLKGVATRQGDYVVAQLSKRMDRPDLVGDIISNWHRLGQRRKTLTFCVDVAHSQHVADEFVKSGVRAEHLDGSTLKPERDAILDRLASGETEVVCNVMVLTEGYDLPAIGCIVLARPTKQLGLFRQMAGRGLRPAEGKSDLILIDHSGAVYAHGLLEDRIEWTLDTDKRAENKTHAARSESAKSRLVECTQCSGIRITNEACPHCGFKPKFRGEAIVFAEGELAEVKNGKAKSTLVKADRDRWHAELIYIAQDKGYEKWTGWAAHKFKDKFGEWPPRVIPAPRKPSPEVLSWVRSRQIAYAKAKQKEREAAA
jgi:superfamily II DNA or RNA helicase